MLFPSLQEGLLLMKCCKVQYDSPVRALLHSRHGFLVCIFVNAFLVPLLFSPGGAVR